MDLVVAFQRPDVVLVRGEIDLATAYMLQGAIDAVEGTVVIDLSAVTFMDASAARMLVGQLRRRLATGDELVVANPSRPVRRVLEVAGVFDYFQVQPDAVREAGTHYLQTAGTRAEGRL